MVLLASAPVSGSETSTAVEKRLKSALITGIAVTIPLIVTLVVIGFVVDFVSGTLNPLVVVVESTVGLGGIPSLAVKAVVFVALVAVILAVGLVAERHPEENGVENTFDRLMASIPGVGSIYTSFNEMSQLLLDSDTDSFREVKLVEFPTQGSYAIAFLTADTPEDIQQAAGHDGMETLFLPMAPNPVMGGHVITVDEERIIDIDMTVSEGIRAIVTSGVAIEDAEAELPEDLPDSIDSGESVNNEKASDVESTD